MGFCGEDLNKKLLTLSFLMTIQEAFVDSVDQDQMCSLIS